MPIDPVRRWYALAVVVAAQFVFVVDAFIVNVAIPTIRSEIGATAGQMQAVIAVYQIAYATTVITGGRLGDMFGRRRLFITGVICFAAASFGCGAAGSGNALVAARLIQGATAALMVPQVLATIHTLFPDAARNRAFAIFGVALGLGGAVGLVLGGWLVTVDLAGLGWRCIFLVNLPICAFIAFAARRLLPNQPPTTGVSLDIPGALLLFAALAGLLGPVMAGRDLGWPLWLWDIVAGGAILLVLFLRQERSVANQGGMPLVDPAMLRDRPFQRGLATVFAFQFGNIAFYLLITLILQGSLGLPPLRAGLVIAPLALTFTLAARLSGAWLARYGTRVLLMGCLIQFLSLLALGAVLNWPPSSMVAPIAIVLLGFGFGQGLVMAPLSGLVLATVRPTHAGSGSGVLNTVHQAAGATGVSAVGMFAFQGQFIAAIALLATALAVTFLLLIDREAVWGKRLCPAVQAAPRSGALSTPRLRAIGSRVK